MPRAAHLPWLLATIWLWILRALQFLFQRTGRRAAAKLQSRICIEAGTRGWESIEFKELYQSACEYLGEDRVVKFCVEQDQDYLKQLQSMLVTSRMTHYVYDPRTGSQDWKAGLWQSLCVATLLQKNHVTPIVLLTDLSVRSWRAQSAVVSARRGIVVSFMSARVVHPIFPHSRLLGPCLMPFSVKTKSNLDDLIALRKVTGKPRAIFTGSLYEPRTSILKEVEFGVKARGGQFEILGRDLGTTRAPDGEYWSRLVNADIVFTTSVQMKQPGTDWTDIPHLLYRYLEVMVSGALLIAEDVPAVRRFFTPGLHFETFLSPGEAVEKIFYYQMTASERVKIARQGKMKADALIESCAFWMLIDAGLGQDSLN